MAAEKKMSIEEGFECLGNILNKMDEEGVSLEESFRLYNEGLMLVKSLNDVLVEAEGRITVVNEE